MKFDEVKENSTHERREYPTVTGTGKLSRIIKKGTTEKGSYIVLGFNDVNLSGIMFGSKEELDSKLNGIEIGSQVNLELNGSKKGNVLKNVSRHEGGEEGENPSSSHKRLSNEDCSAFMTTSSFIDSFKCGSCGEQNRMFKSELKQFIINAVRNCHEN
jgi:hypothetical protein